MSLSSEYPVMRTVPDFVGLADDEARALDRSAGLRITDPDPDAPPSSNHWSEHTELVVLTQSPSPGSRIERQVPVTVALAPPQAPLGARSQFRPAGAVCAGSGREGLRSAAAS